MSTQIAPKDSDVRRDLYRWMCERFRIRLAPVHALHADVEYDKDGFAKTVQVVRIIEPIKSQSKQRVGMLQSFLYSITG